MTITAGQEIAPSSDLESTIIAMITSRAWRDPDYKARILNDPRAVLAEEGLEFPPDTQVKAVSETDVTHIVIDRGHVGDLRYIPIPAQGGSGEMAEPLDGLHRPDVLSATSAATLAVSVINMSASTVTVVVTVVL